MNTAVAYAGEQPSVSHRLREQVLALLNPRSIDNQDATGLGIFIENLIGRVANETNTPINRFDQVQLALSIVNDIMGLGPIEVLVNDPTISDILINGYNQIYIERGGKLQMTDVQFRDPAHLLFVAQRIAADVGRRVDESSPMLDARLSDGSRVNILLQPLAVNGPYISIRKFSRDLADMDSLHANGSVSKAMMTGLSIIAASRLNVIISGGTGAGKTTLLNAMSYSISPDERVATIEDVAEIQFNQPHILTMETRPPNIEGKGEIIARDLVRNALRMRPDRIIVGEVRGAEAFDMMQAMNTGHNGSMTTVHANTAFDALHRIESMLQMAEVNLPLRVIRSQIFSAVDIVVQLERMRDGVRRVTGIFQIDSFDNDDISIKPLWQYHFRGIADDGKLIGDFVSDSTVPRFLHRLEYYGLEDRFMEALAEDRPS
jgi:pilus assembly protein CpaF